MEIQVQQFNSIDDVYDFIDENVFNFNIGYDLINVWVKFREQTLLEEEKQRAQWEVEAFLYEIRGNKVFSLSYSNGKDMGEIKQYPNLDEYQEKAFDYLKSRIEQCKNPELLARYNHLLWKSIKGIKNKRYADKAIENYLELIPKYYKLYLVNNDKNLPNQICISHENLIGLYEETKNATTPLKVLTRQLLFEYRSFDFYAKHSIIKGMIEYPKTFKTEDFQDVLIIFEEELKVTNDKFLWITSYFTTAIKVAKKTKSDDKVWYDRIGFTQLELAEEETEQSRLWLKLKMYADAIKSFSLSGSKLNKQKAEKLYSELKPHVTLDAIEIPYDQESIDNIKYVHEEIKNYVKNVLKKQPTDIYKSLSNDLLLPKLVDILKQTKSDDNSFLNNINTIYFDKNKNITDAKQNDSIYNQDLFNTYSFYVQHYLLPRLHYTFIWGIKSNHLTYKNFLEYLLKDSWIGVPHLKSDLGGDNKKINWIGIVSPAIVEYFVQIQAWVSTKYYRPSFILCIDSLTLKLEGLLRDFCQRHKIPTSTSSGNKGIKELLIKDLLEHELLKKYFHEDELLFFNYVFGNDGGLNVRNNVAHCFYDYEDYYSDMMLLLLFALLRIAKYNYKK